MKKYYFILTLQVILYTAKCDSNSFLLPLITNNTETKGITHQIVKDSEGKIFRESNLVNMKKSGIERKYYPNGINSSLITYYNGRIISILSFDEYGNPSLIKSYSSESTPDGPLVNFHTNGIIKEIRFYSKGILEGDVKYYNQFGEQCPLIMTNSDKYNIRITTNTNGTLEFSGAIK